MPFSKIAFLLYLFILLFCSCENVNTGNYAKKAPGQVPQTYYSALDPAFSKVQDTLFYKGQRFSGYVFALNENKDTSLVMGFLNGLQEGYTRKWYPNKQLLEERFYIQGGKEGKHRGWWENGIPKFTYHFVNDEFEGPLTEWFSNGKLYRQFNYKNGHESGSEKMWWDNGTIRANYVIVNGEKFGLFGQKLCTNKNVKQELK